MYKYIRSPNYLGEVLIYSSYALLANVCSWQRCDVALASLGDLGVCVVYCVCHSYHNKGEKDGEVGISGVDND